MHPISEWTTFRAGVERAQVAARAAGEPAVARDVGHVVHWLKYLEEQAFWEQKVRDGTAVSTGKNRYREVYGIADAEGIESESFDDLSRFEAPTEVRVSASRPAEGTRLALSS